MFGFSQNSVRLCGKFWFLRRVVENNFLAGALIEFSSLLITGLRFDFIPVGALYEIQKQLSESRRGGFIPEIFRESTLISH